MLSDVQDCHLMKGCNKQEILSLEMPKQKLKVTPPARGVRTWQPRGVAMTLPPRGSRIEGVEQI